MVIAVYVPLITSALFGTFAPSLGRRLPPAIATWLLSVGGLVNAVTSIASFATLAFTLVGRSPLLAGDGHWSSAALRAASPVSTPVAVVATAALLLLATRVVVAGTRRLTALHAAKAMFAALPKPAAELTVLDDPGWLAVAVPGRPGQIVMSTGLLRGLDAGERRAVLAHERAHLVHRHHMHHTFTHLVRAANPLLGGLPGAVRLSTERWADEVAARSCPRDTVVGAIARAATGPRVASVPAVLLAAAVTDVTARVHALRLPAPRLSLWRIALLVALLLATTASAVEALRDTEKLLDIAQFAYRSR